MFLEVSGEDGVLPDDEEVVDSNSNCRLKTIKKNIAISLLHNVHVTYGPQVVHAPTGLPRTNRSVHCVVDPICPHQHGIYLLFAFMGVIMTPVYSASSFRFSS